MDWQEILWNNFLGELIALLKHLPQNYQHNVSAYFTIKAKERIDNDESIYDIIASFGSPSWNAQEILNDYNSSIDEEVIAPVSFYIKMLLYYITFLFGFSVLLVNAVSIVIAPIIRLFYAVETTISMGLGGNLLKMQLGGLLFFIGCLIPTIAFLFSMLLLFSKYMSNKWNIEHSTTKTKLTIQNKIKLSVSFKFIFLILIGLTLMSIGGYFMLSAGEVGGYYSPFMPVPNIL